MKILSLRPYLHEVNYFDAESIFQFQFTWQGGDILGSQLGIYDNVNNKLIMTLTSQTSTMRHLTYNPSAYPADQRLQNGAYYNAKLRVLKSDGSYSDYSNTIDFYCVVAPTLFFANPPSTINTSSITLDLTCDNSIRELLAFCGIVMYGEDRQFISESGNLYGADNQVSYTFNGLIDTSPHNTGTIFYFQAYGETIFGRRLESEVIAVKTTYQSIFKEVTGLFQLKNNALHGTISLTVNKTILTDNNVFDFAIKRSKSLIGPWVTVGRYNTNQIVGANLYATDRFADNGFTYYYAIVKLNSDGGEEGYITGDDNGYFTVYSKFDGVWLADATRIYGTVIAPEVTFTQHKPFETVETIDERYPFVMSHNQINYGQGSVSGTFADYNADVTYWDFDNANDYRAEFYDWLYNGEPKILKSIDGRSWIVAITSDIGETAESHYLNVTTNFNWVQIGSAYSDEDIKKNNLFMVGDQL